MTKKTISFSIIFFIVGVIFVGSILWVTTKVIYKDRKIEKEIEALKQDAQRIKNENQSLTQRIAYFETPEFQERVAKEKLNLQKQDENVVVIKPSRFLEDDVVPKETVLSQEQQQLPNYKKWWDYFFAYTQ